MTIGETNFTFRAKDSGQETAIDIPSPSMGSYDNSSSHPIATKKDKQCQEAGMLVVANTVTRQQQEVEYV